MGKFPYFSFLFFLLFAPSLFFRVAKKLLKLMAYARTRHGTGWTSKKVKSIEMKTLNWAVLYTAFHFVALVWIFLLILCGRGEHDVVLRARIRSLCYCCVGIEWIKSSLMERKHEKGAQHKTLYHFRRQLHCRHCARTFFRMFSLNGKVLSQLPLPHITLSLEMELNAKVKHFGFGREQSHCDNCDVNRSNFKVNDCSTKFMQKNEKRNPTSRTRDACHQRARVCDCV